MGFRDLEKFNQAMLAKLSWRIIKTPNSLMACVLRGKYFCGGSFLQAKASNNDYVVWKNIIWGRSLFCEGYKWRVGNGKRVYIEEDPWLMGENCWKPVLVKQELKRKRVEEIVNVDGSWKEETIKDSFLPCDVDTILSMPKRNINKEDEII